VHRICFALLTLALGFPVHADASESALSYQQVAMFTGLILTHEGGPIYLTGLGNALIKLIKTE